jgi:tRNA-specific 2-thiouridylase
MTRKKIFVGMSGGVDSSVSAALLKRAGHDVTGVFIKVWQPDWIECNWHEEHIEAMRAAAHLGIPFVTLDLEKEYKEGVIDYMIAEYAAGRTPNPDVMCNREVKFGAFWRWAKEQGADFIATGHYARIIKPRMGIGEDAPRTRLADAKSDFSAVKSRASESIAIRGERYSLLTGVDSNKDQSYFLWTLTQDDLKHVMFPVGDMTKPEVRKLAKKLKLPNAEKKDSQGLCFIGKVDVKEFLAHYTKGNSAAKYGKVLNEAGQIVGTHPGALFFTIGERHGFEIDSTHKSPNDAAFYVVAKDMNKNTVTVSNKDTSGALAGAVKTVRISRVNWISGVPKIGQELQARSRYRQALYLSKVVSISNGGKTEGIKATIEFDKPQDTLTSGQSLVIYDGEVCVGGGIIEG